MISLRFCRILQIHPPSHRKTRICRALKRSQKARMLLINRKCHLQMTKLLTNICKIWTSIRVLNKMKKLCKETEKLMHLNKLILPHLYSSNSQMKISTSNNKNKSSRFNCCNKNNNLLENTRCSSNNSNSQNNKMSRMEKMLKIQIQDKTLQGQIYNNL